MEEEKERFKRSSFLCFFCCFVCISTIIDISVFLWLVLLLCSRCLAFFK